MTRRMRLLPGWDWILTLVLCVLAVLSRLYTTNTLTGEPTSDEYLFGVYARDLARAWTAGSAFTLSTLLGEGRAIAVEAAALSRLWAVDQLTLGRAIQALLNALCIPATFVLARSTGLAWPGAAAAALLLMAIPEFQDNSWRFWSDSQAALLTVLFSIGLVLLVRGCARGRAVILSAVSLLGLFVTKDTAALTLGPFLLLAPVLGAVPLLRGRQRRAAARLAAVAVLVLVAGLAALTVFLSDESRVAELGRLPLIGRPFLAASVLPEGLRRVGPLLPEYLSTLLDLLGAAALGAGVLWAVIVGWVALVAGSWRTRLAALPWLPSIGVAAVALVVWGGLASWLTIGVGAALAIVGARRRFVPGVAIPHAGALGFLGLIVLAFLAQRLLVVALPQLGEGAAFTIRAFFPTLPLLCVLGGFGLWTVGRSLEVLPLPRVRRLTALATLIVALVLVGLWTPLPNRFTARSQWGLLADRGGDPRTPQGFRVAALVQSEDWLLTNLRPSDTIATGIPRHLAWYADLGAPAGDRLQDMGTVARTYEARRRYLEQRLGPDGVDYVVDFNIDWWRPDSQGDREWRSLYEWLAQQPHLEIVLLRRDERGEPVFFVARNHGYAASYSYVDREEARAQSRAAATTRDR